MYHPTNVNGEDLSDQIFPGIGPCEILGEIPEDGVYGQLTISVDADSIGTVCDLEEGLIDEHVFEGSFGTQENIFEEGTPIASVAYQRIPGGDHQYGIIDYTLDDDGGSVGAGISLSLFGNIENGTTKVGAEDGMLLVIEAGEGFPGYECFHAIGIGEIEISD